MIAMENFQGWTTNLKCMGGRKIMKTLLKKKFKYYEFITTDLLFGIKASAFVNVHSIAVSVAFSKGSPTNPSSK